MSNLSFSSGYGEFVSGEYTYGSSFELFSNEIPIFTREIDSNNSNIVNLDDDYFLIENHNFITGEEIQYIFNQELTNEPISIASTVISGVSTDKLPNTLYAVRLDGIKIQVAASKTEALLDTPKVLDLTSYGKGVHQISSAEQNKNCLITINNVIQSPIVSTYSTSHLTQELNQDDFSATVDDPSLFKGGDLLKINNEFLKILSITDNILDFERGLLGTEEETHLINSVVTKVDGSYNIVDNVIYFTQPPYGDVFTSDNGLASKSTFSGRVFLRSGKKNTSIGPYDNNYIFDDISNQFTGIQSSFVLTSNQNNISGVSTDNAIILINDIFQVPSKLSGNKEINSYVLNENSGISTISFTGRLDFNKYDVNLSELPRGGIIFSIGSTEGLGYQPLISAGGTAIVSAAGTIQSISIGYSGSGYREGLQVVRVGVALSDLVDTNIEYIGTASISNGSIVGVSITNPGIGYTITNTPKVIFDSPLPYFDLPLVYSSGSTGIGTEASIDIVVGQGSSVIDFKLNQLGYGFSPGDILTVSIGGTVGVPTDPTIPFKEFQILVDDVYYDKFYGWSIGELILIDNFDDLFDGQRKVFPLKINGEQTALLTKIGSDLDIQNNLLVFIDSVLQVPGEGYFFDGGSIIEFSEPPFQGSKCSILFYGGTSGVDTEFTEVLQTIKIGDTVQLLDNRDIFYNQNKRTVTDITSADFVNTNLYSKQGISITNEYRPITWCLQTEDKFISGSGSTTTSLVSKDRRIYEPLIYPTSYVINSIGSTDTTVFVDNVKTFFDNAKEPIISNDITIISQEVQVAASATAIVSAAGTIQSIAIGNSGFGYFNPPQISISNPIGIGSTATVSLSINALGQIQNVSITNPGSGYTFTSPPVVLIEQPSQKFETINGVSYDGDFGIITGVSTSTDGAVFDLYIPINSFIRDASINSSGSISVSGIQTGYYFTIKQSNIGSNITSLRTDNSVIGVSTEFMDNVYQVYSYSIKQKAVPGIGLTSVNEVVVKISNTSSLVGYANSGYYGDFSWGRIYGLNRTGINSYFAYSPGITTSSIIQRNIPLKYFNYNI